MSEPITGNVDMPRHKLLIDGGHAGNRQEEESFHIFQPEQRRAYHEHHHD